MKRSRAIALHVLAPVAVGAMIYLLFRSPSLRVFDWVESLGLAESVLLCREIVAPIRIVIPDFIFYALPDGLWVYGLTSAMLLLWVGSRSGWATVWITVGLVLGLGGELGQLINLVPGTFDMLDMMAVGVGFVLAFEFRDSEGRGKRWLIDGVI